MPVRNVHLSDEQSHFVAELIRRGDYPNISRAVHAGLELLIKATPQTAAEYLSKKVQDAFGNREVAPENLLTSQSNEEEFMASLKRRFDRRVAFWKDLDALIATHIESGEYRYAVEAIDDALFHLERRLDSEQPPPKGAYLSLLKRDR